MTYIYKPTKNYRGIRPVVIGIYFLFEGHSLVYVGQSNNCYSRIDHHRAASRPFDFALVMPCTLEDVSWVEKALIYAMAPRQNSKGTRELTAQGMSVLQEIARTQAEEGVAPQQGVRQVWYDRLYAIPLSKARQLATDRGIPQSAVDRAWREKLATFAKNDLPTAQRVVRVTDFDAWCEAYQNERMLLLA